MKTCFGVAVAAPLGLLLAQAASACATCGCSLNADAVTGYSTSAGLRLSVQYDYLHQDELRQGTGTAAGVPPGDELERETLNRYVTAGVSYSPSADWRLDLRLPYVIRSHSTFGEYDPGQPYELSSSHSSSVGDGRVVVNYQGLLPTRNLGLQLGVKLPTGAYGTHVNFSSGPLAATSLDASLQPGTGSTDIIAGAYYYQPFSQSLDLFATGQWQHAVRERLATPGNDFRPGDATTLSAGLRYIESPRVTPQLQINLTRHEPDRGALADTQGTAGTTVFASPGVSVRAMDRMHLYGFLQVPVYRNLSGHQLSPRYVVTVGLSYGF
jgi:hypothetical protein